jgi:hypothetical protein
MRTCLSILKLRQASYYLEIDGLGDVTCHGLAQLMEGKSPQQLREMFNIVNDFRGDEEGNAAANGGKWSEDPNARACLEGRKSSCTHGSAVSNKTTSSQTSSGGPKASRKQLRRKQNGAKVTTRKKTP